MSFTRSRHYREPLILRPLPERHWSRSAMWSVRFAVFAPILAVIAVLAHRSGIIETPAFLTLVACVAGIAIVGVILIFAALRSLWLNGKKGGRYTIWALFFSILTLAPFTAGTIAYLAKPHQNDVSTDLVDPPLFRSEDRLTGANPSPIVAGYLRDGYPELTGRRYKAPPEAILETIQEVAAGFGWTLVSRRGRIGADDELFFEFSNRTPVIYMPGSVVLRLADEGDTSFVDVRARTDYVSHDLGWNADLIARYLKALDFELIGIVEG
jgi:uncharacterized membrane protein